MESQAAPKTFPQSSPILTPAAFFDGRTPWVLDTPTPSELPVQRAVSDPFGLRSTAIAMTTPKNAEPLMIKMASLVTSKAPSGKPSPIAELAKKRSSPADFVSRGLIREVCRPFFEQMVVAVEEAVLSAWSKNAEESNPQCAHDDVTDDDEQDSCADPDEYPFVGICTGYGDDSDAEDFFSCRARNTRHSTLDSEFLPLPSSSLSDVTSLASGVPLQLREESSSSILKSISQEVVHPVPEEPHGEQDVMKPSSTEETQSPVASHLASEFTTAGSPMDRSLTFEPAAVDFPKIPEAALAKKARGNRGGRNSKIQRDLASKKGAVAKSSVVCSHWTSKGWCRYQDMCKFAHPESLRGMASPDAGDASSKAVCKVAAPSPVARALRPAPPSVWTLPPATLGAAAALPPAQAMPCMALVGANMWPFLPSR